jgi:hypothetical protein
MKKLLTMVALLATFSSFGQIQKWVKPTHYMSTSEMVWSAIDQEFLFFDNHDYHEQGAVWEITLDVVTGEGFVTSGSVTYRVNETTIEEKEGVSMVVMKAYNETIQAPVMIISSTIKGMFKLGVFVESHKKVYYFYE